MGFLLTHELVLGKNSSPIGVRLFLNHSESSSFSLDNLLDLLNDEWLFGEKALFLSFKQVSDIPLELDSKTFPPHVVVEFPASLVFKEEGRDLVNKLNDKRVSLCLNFDFDFETSQILNTGVKSRFVGFESLKFNPAKVQLMSRKVDSLGIPIITGVETLSEFNTYTSSGVGGVSGWFFTKNNELPAKAINSTQMNVVKLLNLVRNNAEVKEIENALKQDVALSYKLLRYLNSASMGFAQEIQSFKHAVNMLGYEKLNRWLSLLLVTASKDAMAPALMYTSLSRARFMELIGKGKVDKIDDLFITGVFSLLDVILGVKMEKALDAMLLPEPICSALLGIESNYFSILSLARACESQNDKDILKFANAIGVSLDDVNKHFLTAQAFASQMQL